MAEIYLFTPNAELSISLHYVIMCRPRLPAKYTDDDADTDETSQHG